MPPVIIKSRQVLYLGLPEPQKSDPEMVRFTKLNDENPSLAETFLLITYDDWVELDRPGIITVTVETGDLLNSNND